MSLENQPPVDTEEWRQERYKKQEIEGRPQHRYVYHGTALKNWPKIRDEGFSFKEGRPSVSISASYSLKGWADPEKLIEKGRLNGEDVEYEEQGNILNPEDKGVLLVIEPNEFKAYPVRDGFPMKSNDETLTRGRWYNYHHILAHPDKEIIPENKVVLNPDEVKMALKPTRELLKTLMEFRKQLAEGNFEKEQYIRKLSDYMKTGEPIIFNKDVDSRELAQDMIDGETEKFVVEIIRKILLNIKHFQGEKIFVGGKHLPFKNWTKEELYNKIENLRKLKVDDKDLQINIDKALIIFDSELARK